MEYRYIAEMMAAAYVKAYGLDKWNSLTEKEQHDVVIFLANTTNKALAKIAATC